MEIGICWSWHFESCPLCMEANTPAVLQLSASCQIPRHIYCTSSHRFSTWNCKRHNNSGCRVSNLCRWCKYTLPSPHCTFRGHSKLDYLLVYTFGKTAILWSLQISPPRTRNKWFDLLFCYWIFQRHRICRPPTRSGQCQHR